MTIPRPASCAGGGAGGGGRDTRIAVDVTGARGNTEIMEMVQSGVAAGIATYDRGLNRGLGDRVRRSDSRYRASR